MARIDTIERLREIIPEAAPLVAAKILDHLDDQALAFISRAPFLIMATSGDLGIELSPKGDDPGFIHIEGPRSIVIPERQGNRLALGLQNILTHRQIGLAVFRPSTWEVLRITGKAELVDDAELCEQLSARGQAALLGIRVEIDRAYFHCARSLRRAKLWEPVSWGAPGRISFGRIIASATGRNDLERRIDEAVGRAADDL